MSEQQKPEQKPAAAATPAAAAASTSTEEKISPAEAKKRAKAEKQARRAAEKEEKGLPAVTAPLPSAPSAANGEVKGGQQKKAGTPKQNDTGKKPSGAQAGSLPVRARRASQPASSATPPKLAVKKAENKQVELFSHLYTQPRRQNLENVPKDVHPAVLALGLQISSYEICGSSARCVAMLQAFKDAIQTYTTPVGTSLARHLTSHYLSPQIDFLKSCRPISESMGNAIRWLKKLIVEIDPATPEQEAKDYLSESIDKFIQERITVTDQAIAASASSLIKSGSVVLTYAKSAIVEKTILQAHADGTSFRVLVVDSRPLYEGKNLAHTLMNAGVQVEYLPFSGIAHAVKDATLVLLGAHSMLSNGRLMSRVGTASVAIAAHKADVPVIVCCESVKFSGKVALDSIVLNEVAPAEELLLAPSLAPTPATEPGKKDDTDGEEKTRKTLHDWKDIPNLRILNLMYDVTPAECLRMVICEYGNVPPSSVPVVHRLANEGM
ncbi:uncharacterized protein MYCGRDRAFT_55269 [Zymoseptoria tritici IPO323]|uniref:Translation initiation factor eIF2B subunit delta n=1 Tax=Zymoseptoria tritici (strain CBS 115943 / IPO323) TaxID=336722 RepID=F9X2W2_ZYMTI|nr:uncharacterized protein MYCGRDRAFT_55269 [Zymoseptoria tritici IPO323]EGP90532.1 hypothetical protein MYCGRDRAFT_55269 [Zymoseptoria tritici IPO323]